MKPINTLPPFKRLCVTIGNLPSSYVDSMSYYECLLWLINYLQKTVIPAINENAEAVKEIQDWIKNLDLQDEVDTKLDEMAESGELQEIISEYLNSKAIFGFDTVEDMKSATNLIDGSYAKTLGYYSINDNGSGLYRIRTVTNEDVVDEGSIIAMNDESLVAELIFSSEINVKQFGAKGDGTHDDSTNIQNAIDYLTNIIKESSDYAKNNTLYFPAGRYKVNSQIVLSQFVKLRTSGYAVIESYVANDSTIHILPETDFNNTIGNREDWFRGSIIDGSSGLMIKYMGDKDNDNATAIEIGSRTNFGVGHGVNRYSIKEFRVMNFSTGILFNTYNVYISEISRVHFETNNIAIKYGTTTDLSNSGEKFTYNECIFAGCYKCVEWVGTGYYSYFNDCNFDFNYCMFYTGNNQGDHFVNVENGHIEEIGIDNNDGSVPSGIFDGTFNDTDTFVIKGNYIYHTKVDKLFKSNSNPFLIMKDNKFRFQLSDFGKNNYAMADDKIIIFEWRNNTFNLRLGKFVNKNMNLLKPALQSVTAGSQTFTTGVIGLWNVTSKSNVSNTIDVIANNPFDSQDKTMKIYKADTSVSDWNIKMQTKNAIPVESLRYLICSAMLSKKPKNLAIRLVFLDKNGSETGRSDTTFNIGSDVDYGANWWLSPYVKRSGVPKESTHVIMQVEYYLPEDQTEIEIGSMLLQYE